MKRRSPVLYVVEDEDGKIWDIGEPLFQDVVLIDTCEKRLHERAIEVLERGKFTIVKYRRVG